MRNNNPENLVKAIHRRTRRKYSAEEKIRIVLEGLRGEEWTEDLSANKIEEPCIYSESTGDIMSLKYKHLLVITYGRSGSTLLQGVLNSIDGMLVRGENYNFCYHLYLAHEALFSAKQRPRHVQADATGAWFGANEFQPAEFRRECSKNIREQIAGNQTDAKCIGFKEVRYHTIVNRDNKLESYLNWLQKVLPDTGLIFNTRDINAVVKSGMWKTKDKTKVTKELTNTEKAFRLYGSERANCFHMTYEELTKNSNLVRNMFIFLGADYNSQSISKVLSVPHSENFTQESTQILSRSGATT